MKRLIATTVSLFALVLMSQAQMIEVGALMGVSNYAGDLTPEGVENEEFKLAYGILARYNHGHHLSFRFGVSKATISGSDVHTEVGINRRERNLSFQSDIYEVAMMAEFNLFGYNVLENISQFTPYAFVGIAGFYHNPQAYIDNRWYDLQPLGTEGQGMEGYPDKYKKFQFGIPMGLGFKASLSEYVNIGFEIGGRKTFTDYLDDVSTVYPNLQQLGEQGDLIAVDLSYRTAEYDPALVFNRPEGHQRGNPDAKDWYFIGGVSLTFNLGVGGYGYSPVPHARPKF
ncbi:MAG: DUF6089 family protein [Bacteroidota bacterium]